MARLVRVPVGCSARRQFCAELESAGHGQGVLVLPNRLLQDEVQRSCGVECLGMDRFANKILNINGYIDFAEINRRSQELVVQELIEYLAAKDKLEYFGALAKKQGFVKAMTSLVGQLSRTGVTETDLVRILESWGRSGHQGQKDGEIAQLYALYRQYLKNRNWFDLEGKYRLAIWVLQKEKVRLPWSSVYFSDFYTFDNLQLEFLRELSQHCQVAIGISYEKNNPACAAVEPTYNDLQDFCQVEFGGVEPCALADENVRIAGFTSREDEIRWVLTEVKQSLLQGAAPKDFLLVVRDMKGYTGLRSIADEYGIPVSVADTASLAVQPLAELCRLLLAAAAGSRQGAEAYLRLLGSGMGRILFTADMEAVQDLQREYYFTSRSHVRGVLIEKLAEQAGDSFLQKLDSFIDAVPYKATLGEYGQQLTELLQSLELEQRLGALYKEKKISMEGLSSTLQARDGLISCIKQLVQDYTSCGKDKESLLLSRFQELLQEAVAQVELVLHPGREDGVLITEVISAQGLAPKHVYLLGLREGEFPCAGNENWIYNDKERGELRGLGIEMPDTYMSFKEDAYFFATAVAVARESLTATYYEEDGIGASQYIEELVRLYPALQVVAFSEKPIKYLHDLVKDHSMIRVQELANKKPASIEEYAHYGRELSTAFALVNYDEMAIAMSVVDSYRKKFGGLGDPYLGVFHDEKLQQAIRKQVGSSFSASALETYAACPFAYLGERVWLQDEFAPKEDAVNPADEGSLLHAVLAAFMEPYLGKKLTNKPIEALEQELEQVFRQLCLEYVEQGIIIDSVLWEAEQPRLLNLLRRWLRYEYAEQKSWQHYTPCATEWDFSSQNGKPLQLRLDDGSNISLRGRIDRIDSDGEKLFITDYKRSSAPAGADVEKGFDLQLPLYLLAAANQYAGGKPVAGGSYYVLKEGKRKSAFLLESVGNPDMKYKPLASGINEGWESFAKYSEGLIKGYAKGIYSGDFAVKPRKKCSDYCPMRNICRIGVMGTNMEGEADD